MKENYSLKKLLFKSLIICSLLTATTSLKAVSYGPNLILNPGFEQDYTSWAKSASNTVIETILDNVISETKCIRFSNVNSGQFANVNQVVTVVSGETYRFMYTGRVLDAAGPSGGTYTAPRALNGEVRSGNLAAGAILLNLKIEQGTDITVSGEFTVPEGVTQVFVRLIKSFGICYADDVAIQLKDITSGLNKDLKHHAIKVITKNDNSISVLSEDPLKQLRLMNICGQTIYSVKGSDIQTEISLNNITKGIYIIEGITENGVALLSKFINK